MTQEARLPFRTVIQLDPSTHRCQKILGFLNVASCLEFHLSEFSLQQSNMATHTILLVDVFTSCTMYNRYNSSYWIWNRILFWTLDDLSCLFFNLIRINCQTLHLCQNQTKRIPMPSKILNSFKICAALVLLPHPSTSSHPKCGYLHGVWAILQKRFCLIKWNHKIFDKDPQLDNVRARNFSRWQDFLLMFRASLRWPPFLKLLVFHMNSFGNPICLWDLQLRKSDMSLGLHFSRDTTSIYGWCSESAFIQGSLGDCWLMSVLSCLAAQPSRIKRLFNTKHLTDAGHQSSCSTGVEMYNLYKLM